MAEGLQLVAQTPVVVDLAVEDDVGAAVLVGDGLITRLEIDDAQARHAEGHPPVDVIPDGVGTAMTYGPDHPLEDGAVRAPTGRQQKPRDPAHGG